MATASSAPFPTACPTKSSRRRSVSWTASAPRLAAPNKSKRERNEQLQSIRRHEGPVPPCAFRLDGPGPVVVRRGGGVGRLCCDNGLLGKNHQHADGQCHHSQRHRGG